MIFLRQHTKFIAGLALFISTSAFPSIGSAFSLVPTDEEITKYRQSWNPFSEGPLLIQSVDIHPQGQLSVRPFLFS
ncbi:MAG TPA: hypothetical protein VFS39_03225, partial [Nitrospira sp.]|nr:hypothetical protein [Nitrospira sp.]